MFSNVISSWVLVAYLVTKMYSSSLVSHLTTEYYPKSVNSIKDLVQRGYRLLAPTAIDADLYFNTTVSIISANSSTTHQLINRQNYKTITA